MPTNTDGTPVQQPPPNTQLGGNNFFSSLFAPNQFSNFQTQGAGNPNSFFGGQASTLPLASGSPVPPPPQFSAAQLSPNTDAAQNPTFAFGLNQGQGQFFDQSQGTVLEQYIAQLQALAQSFEAFGNQPPAPPPIFNFDFGPGTGGSVAPTGGPRTFGGIIGPRTAKVNPTAGTRK